jgi:drug/metabolite transporter (DMT)-like permease
VALAFLRFSFAAILLAPLLLRDRGRSNLSLRGKGHPALVGLCGFCASYLLLYFGISMTSATETAIIVNLEPIFTVLLGWAFLAERLGRSRSAGIAVAFAGALLLLRPENGGTGWALDRTVGNLFIVAGVAAEAGATVLSRRLRQVYTASGLAARAVAWGALFLLVPALLQWRAHGYTTEWFTPRSLLAIVYLSAGCTVVAYLVWYRLLAKLEAGTAASFIYLQPLVGIAAGMLLLGEPLRQSALAGGIVIGIGIFLASRAARPPDGMPACPELCKNDSNAQSQ